MNFIDFDKMVNFNKIYVILMKNIAIIFKTAWKLPLLKVAINSVSFSKITRFLPVFNGFFRFLSPKNRKL